MGDVEAVSGAYPNRFELRTADGAVPKSPTCTLAELDWGTGDLRGPQFPNANPVQACRGVFGTAQGPKSPNLNAPRPSWGIRDIVGFDLVRCTSFVRHRAVRHRVVRPRAIRPDPKLQETQRRQKAPCFPDICRLRGPKIRAGPQTWAMSRSRGMSRCQDPKDPARANSDGGRTGERGKEEERGSAVRRRPSAGRKRRRGTR